MEKAMNRRRVGFNFGIIVLASLGAFVYGRQFSKERKERSKALDEGHFK